MLHNKLMTSRANFRELTDNELDAVSGGTDSGHRIVVSYNRPAGLSGIDIQNLFGDLQQAAIQMMLDMMEGTTEELPAEDFHDVGFVDDLRQWLEDNAEWLAEEMGKDLITPEKETVLNNDMNGKEISSVYTITLENGDKWRTVTTTDGVTYYDRDGNGYPDLKTRFTPFGEQADTGDGRGWTIPGS